MIKIETAIRYFIVAANQKSIQSGTSRLVLGTRAPAPAMSAKRETVTASRRLRLSVLRTLRRARAPALPVLASLPATPLFGQGPTKLMLLPLLQRIPPV